MFRAAAPVAILLRHRYGQRLLLRRQLVVLTTDVGDGVAW
jgi:hypothetical protein